MDTPEFEIVLNGYNTEQVDSYIKEIRNELLCANIRNEKISEEIKVLRSEFLSVVESMSRKLEIVNAEEVPAAAIESEKPAESKETNEFTQEKSDSGDSFEEAKKDFEAFGKELQSVKAIFE
ncbi:MAG: hypothetical protein MJ173_01870 [Clostridia bacterium]|nr:hypothetical protein [Clostridia bacterium]